MHTHYDQALKVMDRNGARVAVEKDVIRKLIEWRGEGDPVAGAPELEEFFREVIVIDSDDEDNANKTGIFRPSSQTQIQPSVQAPPPVHSPDRYDVQNKADSLTIIISRSVIKTSTVK